MLIFSTLSAAFFAFEAEKCSVIGLPDSPILQYCRLSSKWRKNVVKTVYSRDKPSNMLNKV